LKIAAKRIADLWRRLCKSRLGNVTIIFAFAMPVILIAAGGAVDYAQALTVRGELRDATDAAAVGCIATNSAAYNKASTTTQNGSLQEGVDAATLMFTKDMAHMQNQGTYTDLVVTPVVTKNNQNLTATITATATYHTFLLSYIGINTIALTATSSAANATPGYMDFYLLLDVSGSMGLPSTDSEQTRLAAVNPDDKSQYPLGCTLACHFDPITTSTTQNGHTTTTTSYTWGYALSRNGGNLACAQGTQTHGCPTPVSNCPVAGASACIQLRLDAVGYAVNQLLSTANTTATLPSQYRVGLYPFIRYMDPNYAPLTANITGSTMTSAATNLANELDTGTNSTLGSGGTHFENALPAISGVIPAQSGGFTGAVGSGASATNTLPWVFFVTDGSQDSQYYTSSSNSWAGSNHATYLSPASLCTNIKSRGIRIAVLYIPYQPIQNPNTSFAGNEDTYANNNIANIPAPLQACASPGFYFTANTPADIAAALQTMFKQAITSDRLTL
jgi:Flp pilus assembly protein TadG